MRKKTFRSFTQARKFVRKLELKSTKYWTEYCKSGKLPVDIPRHPGGVYKKEWKGMGDWLGTDVIPNAQLYESGYYLPFEKARKFVRSLNIKTMNEWQQYCKSGEKPKNIPRNASRVYKKEWKGMGDWLGTGRVANQNREYRTFDKARKYARKLGFEKREEWRNHIKSGKKPIDIPSSPENIYKKEWNGWGDWFGHGGLSSTQKSKLYVTFKVARKFAHTLNLKNYEDWKNFRKNNKKKLAKLNVPANPGQAYKNKGWTDWGDFLGTGRVANQNKEYRSFEKARKFVHKLKLKSTKYWRQYCKSGKLPDDIPLAPSLTYKKEWTSWGDFLGTGTLSSIEQSAQWLSAEEARIAIKKIAKEVFDGKPFSSRDWIKAHREGKIPKNLPSNLANVYDPKYKKHKGDDQ